MPKSAPETGVPKTAANPAPTPQITRRRRSLSSSRSTSAKRLVIAAPICAHGPSLPTEPPKASVTTVARSLIGATSQSTLPDRWWIAAMTASVPCPFAEGAKVRMSHTHSGSASGSRKYGRHHAPGSVRSARCEAAPRDQRKARVPQPTQAPATAPRSAHFRVVTTRAACSVYQRPSSARRGGSARRRPSRAVLPSPPRRRPRPEREEAPQHAVDPALRPDVVGRGRPRLAADPDREQATGLGEREHVLVGLVVPHVDRRVASEARPGALEGEALVRGARGQRRSPRAFRRRA